MSKQGAAKKRKSDNKPPEEEHQFSGEMAARRMRREKFERYGKIDLKDYPRRRQIFPGFFT